jgi:hypothetical protein
VLAVPSQVVVVIVGYTSTRHSPAASVPGGRVHLQVVAAFEFVIVEAGLCSALTIPVVVLLFLLLL